MTQTRRFSLTALRFFLASIILIGQAPFIDPAPAHANDAAEDTQMNVVLIGATSRAAQQIIPQAIAKGYHVVGVARRPEAITFEDENFKAMKGDVYDLSSLEAALTSNDIVISMVGPKAYFGEDHPPTDLMTQGTANILQAMRNKGSKRLIVASSSLSEVVPYEGPPPLNATDYDKYRWNMRAAYQDERDMEAIVRMSGVENVILRPGFLVDEASKNNLQLLASTQGRIPTPKRTIVTYADFASFTVDQVSSDAYLGKTVGIYSDVCPEGSTYMEKGCVHDLAPATAHPGE
jgi:putative NADH-flavin reductase